MRTYQIDVLILDLVQAYRLGSSHLDPCASREQHSRLLSLSRSLADDRKHTGEASKASSEKEKRLRRLL